MESSQQSVLMTSQSSYVQSMDTSENRKRHLMLNSHQRPDALRWKSNGAKPTGPFASSERASIDEHKNGTKELASQSLSALSVGDRSKVQSDVESLPPILSAKSISIAVAKFEELNTMIASLVAENDLPPNHLSPGTLSVSSMEIYFADSNWNLKKGCERL